MNSKILILFVLLITIVGVVGIVVIHTQENPMDFEYKKYNPFNLFNLSSDYKQYLKPGKVDKELKNVFEEHNISLSNDARISRGINPCYWKIKDNKRTYIIGDTCTEKPLEVDNDVDGGYIKNITWKNNVLIVDVIVSATGDDPNLKLFGNYDVNKNNISLTVSETKSYCMCIGYYSVRFKIKNLEKKDYNVMLYTNVMGHGKLLIDERQIGK